MTQRLRSARIVSDARERAGLSQRELAKRARTAQSVVARIELGETSPSVDTLTRILRATGFEAMVDLEPIARMARHSPVVQKAVTDLVVDAYKHGIDRTLLRENLKKTPDQRVRALVGMARFVDEAQRSSKSAKRK
jgi:transcriptional regulator with XRE-family HTH domain